METLTGMYAYSKAGHDKGTLYLIIKEDKESVTLCDGLLKTIEHPKKKNKKHIQPVKEAMTHCGKAFGRGCHPK